eukprot:6266229-Alexandrium_andersonii.AAC.1
MRFCHPQLPSSAPPLQLATAEVGDNDGCGHAEGSHCAACRGMLGGNCCALREVQKTNEAAADGDAHALARASM